MSLRIQSSGASPAVAGPKYEGAAFEGLDERARGEAHAALAEMLAAIERIRTAMRAIVSTAKTAVSLKDAAGRDAASWPDLMFILQNTVARMERGWRELSGNPDPRNTKAYLTAKAVAWDLRQHIDAIPREERVRIAGLVKVRGAWPQEIVFEPSFRGKCATYKEVLDAEATRARGKDTYSVHATYESRTPRPGASDFVYPGFSAHFEWKKESLYYQTQINFAAILEVLRARITDGAILPRMGATYMAHLIYCFYEIVLATLKYVTSLNAYFRAAGEPEEMLFDFIHERVIADAADSPTWEAVVVRARDEAYYVCRDLHEQAERTTAADILGGVNAKDLAKDPSQISGILEKITGVPGLDLNALKSLPGFGQISELFSGLTAGAARS